MVKFLSKGGKTPCGVLDTLEFVKFEIRETCQARIRAFMVGGYEDWMGELVDFNVRNVQMQIILN